MEKRTAIACLLAMTIGLSLGCTVFETGPRVVTSVLESTSGTARALVSTYQPEQMAVDLNGDVNDPTYRIRTFVGTGVLVDIMMGIQGANVHFGLDSTGHGLPIDREFAQEVTAIMGNQVLSDEKRLDAINAALVAWLNRLNPASQPPGTSPEPPAASQPPGTSPEPPAASQPAAPPIIDDAGTIIKERNTEE